MTQQDILAQIAGQMDTLRSKTVLYAGANLPEPQVLDAYSPALSAYPAMGPSYQKEQPGTELVSALEIELKERLCSMFGAAWAEPRLLSCTMANLAVFHCFSKPGDLMFGPAAAHGGHLSQRRGGTPELAGLVVEDLPFDTARVALDPEAAADRVRQRRPALVVFGRSVMIRPDEIGPVVAAAREVGAKTLYDASHVLGLIAGGAFPNPLEAGVDLLTSSTYKTFPSRPHAIVVGTNPEDGLTLADIIDGRLMANGDAGRLPQLLSSLRLAEKTIHAYAEATCRKSAELAAALRAAGVPVIAPQDGEIFTHQLLVPLATGVDARKVMAAFQERDVLVGSCADPTRPGEQAIRVGTQFITLHGAPLSGVADIARCFAKLLCADERGGAMLRESA